ncbi:MAG: hypothetical protein HBSAPP03_03650 [Phycisphaerae bacterium]|nr:MAG: hypothetical protein HBSAPP03_03650 [Phycisphaerae bacterium]
MNTMLFACAASAALVGPAAPSHREPVSLTVHSIRETRLSTATDEATGLLLSCAPGLFVRLMPTLPEGTKVLDVVQPESITATDNLGADLSQIEPDFFDRREWVEHDSFADTDAIVLKLALPSRKAETFSVRAEAKARVSSGFEMHDLEPVEKWTAFKHPALAAIKAEYRFKREDDRGTFRVRPTEARAYIESVVPATDDATEPQGYSISYNDEFASFDVEVPEPGQKLRLFLHKNLRTLPLVIELKDQPLP